MNTRTLIGMVILGVILAACSPANPSPIPTPIKTDEPPAPISGMATVQSVEIQILGSDPLQVNAIVRGQLPDTGCTAISTIDQVRSGNTFHVTLTTMTDPKVMCAAALSSFEEVIWLDTGDLPPAPYVVNANGVQQAFELLPRDLANFKQALGTALNERNYELLGLMMDKSLMIADWRSQGSAYDVEPAIEQLKLNHLSSNSAIVADLNKDFSTLPTGADPLSVFGLDVGLTQGLFVSGWGPEGKDEAILYVNYLLDGSLYWHGVLVAKGGFEQSAAQPAP